MPVLLLAFPVIFFATEFSNLHAQPGQPAPTENTDHQPQSDLNAPAKRTIEWQPVAGANGYLVQIKNETLAERNREEEVAINRIEIELPPGVYRLRVAALNKFGQPAAWSDWWSFTLQPSGDAPSDSSLWARANPRMFVPGWTQIERGDTWRGVAYAGAIIGLAGYYGWHAKIDGDNYSYAAEDLNFYYLYAYSARNIPLTGLLTLQRNELRAAYDQKQDRQRLIGWTALALYLFQIADALWWGTADESETIQLGHASSNSTLSFSFDWSPESAVRSYSSISTHMQHSPVSIYWPKQEQAAMFGWRMQYALHMRF
ncbi:MAG: hypothetical protein KDK30_02880 [Leptospiraceae bacterium]|nr:hypothetical protein [Leptospiraceae bacterium]